MNRKLIWDQYGLEVRELCVIPAGVGGVTYQLGTAKGKYILKANKEDEYFKNEPEVASCLQAGGIPVPEYVLTKSNEYFWRDDGNLCLMYRYIEGCMLDYNTAPDWFMSESARLLGKMHTVLSGFRALPVGMGKSFIDFMASGYARQSYQQTLTRAQERGDIDIANDVAYRLSQVDKLNRIAFDLSKLTCGNTHGDYKISNILCGDHHIAAIIDLSSACVHPLIWEVIRSFTYASPHCRNGEIDIPSLLDYVHEYLRYTFLSKYDLQMMPYYLYCQILACDYYRQYYDATEQNRDDFLHQAQFATKLIRWFETHMEDLSEQLSNI